MASKLSFLTLFMEKKKPPKHTNNTNDLSFVKAAAWAWYQHNSGSKGKPITEFDATITQRAPRPSRYKLEAMRMAQEQEALDEGSSIHTNKLSLLDEYEVQSISKRLNGLMDSSSNNNSDNKVVNGDDPTNKRVQKKRVMKRFWLRHGAVCGREGDVVDPSCLRVGRSGKASTHC